MTLKANDLQNMIYPIISVDEYQPKMNDENIVVCFQVLDSYDAAYDLSSFLEKCPVDILDTEAPETPNLDGRYNVFVEFAREMDFPKKFNEMIEDIERLSNKQSWQIQAYKINDPMKYEPEILVDAIRLAPKDKLREFFEQSKLRTQYSANYILLKSKDSNEIKHVFESVTEISEEDVSHLINEGRYALDTSNLEANLGDGFSVVKACGGFVIHNGTDFLLMR